MTKGFSSGIGDPSENEHQKLLQTLFSGVVLISVPVLPSKLNI